MANADSLKGLMKWLSREEWRQPYNELIERHLGPPCEQAGIAFDELAAKIGQEHVGVLWGCMFEDFLAFELDDDSNIVDDYLKRRGWKESVPNKRYMMALRFSVMSLYEVSDIVRDQSFLARDLLRGGEPVRISEKSATQSLKQWDLIAARVVRTGSKVEMAGGVLALSHEQGEVIRETFAALRKDMLAEVRKSAGHRDEEVDPFVFDTEILWYSAFLFTHVWLNDFLERVLNPTPPKLHNSDGDEIEFTTVHYPLRDAGDRAALEAASPPCRSSVGTMKTFGTGAPHPRLPPRRRPMVPRPSLRPSRTVRCRWAMSSWRERPSSSRPIHPSAPCRGRHCSVPSSADLSGSLS